MCVWGGCTAADVLQPARNSPHTAPNLILLTSFFFFSFKRQVQIISHDNVDTNGVRCSAPETSAVLQFCFFVCVFFCGVDQSGWLLWWSHRGAHSTHRSHKHKPPHTDTQRNIWILAPRCVSSPWPGSRLGLVGASSSSNSWRNRETRQRQTRHTEQPGERWRRRW